MLEYRTEDDLDPREFLRVLNESTLGERRPVDDVARIEAMVRGGNLLVTARRAGVLVGVARSVTDFVYCCYLSDLAVVRAEQGNGVGRRLLEETRARLHPDATLILLSAPAATGFYPKTGMRPHDAAFVIRAGD